MLITPFSLKANESDIEEILVVGSRINSQNLKKILPVTIINSEELKVLGIDSGDDLIMSLVENGTNRFNDAGNAIAGVNSARGDMGAFNLRNLGTGNTLVLMNGRRLINSPSFQSESVGGSFVPVNSVNTNIIPVNGIERVEVLRDGSSAIYGADAVAGVINFVTKKNKEGFEFNFKNYKLSELIYWFKTPQHYWLNKKNISPKGIFIHHPDEEFVTNFQKSQLVSKVIQKIGIDNHNIVDELMNLNINDQFLENGVITPKNSFFTKEKEIKDLVGSLASNLGSFNKIKKVYVKSDSNKEEYFIADNVVVELVHSKLSLKLLSEAWIKLLFISSINNNIKQTKVVFRKDNQYKSEILKSPGQLYSKRILDEYINIFKNCSQSCLPFPPESTYKYVEAKMLSKNEKKAFSERWIGNKNFIKGERDNIEMKMCFGTEKDPDFFLSNNEFDNLSCKIYRPLLEALQNN